MSCDALVEAVLAEDAEGGGQAAFEVFTLFVLVGEGWWSVMVLSVSCTGEIALRWQGSAGIG